MVVLPEITLSNATDFPVNGFGGSYYNTPFYIPTYHPLDPGVYNVTSWADVDNWAQGNANEIATESICLGLCIATLAYIFALTPTKKRGMPFHSFLLLALVFQILRFLCDVVRVSNPETSQFSAYLFLSNDLAASTISSSFRGVQATGLLAGLAAFSFANVCLYVQSTGLLCGVRMKHPKAYKIILAYLVTVAIIAILWRTTLTAYQLRSLLNPSAWYSFDLLHQGTLVAYTISIGSWSLVSLISVTFLVVTRTRMILGSNRLYDAALNLIGLICLESFILPLIFCVLQLVPQVIGIIQPEHIVLTSVLVLLPLGSLFMTVHTAELNSVNNQSSTANSQRPLMGNSGGTAKIKEGGHRQAVVASDRRGNSVLSTENYYPLEQLSTSTPGSRRLALAYSPIDRELEQIDAMGQHDGNEEEERNLVLCNRQNTNNDVSRRS